MKSSQSPGQKGHEAGSSAGGGGDGDRGGHGAGGHGRGHRRTRNTPRDVTANACTQCKKARTKCDGKQPCHRCSQRGEGATCEYRVHVKMAKEEIVQKFTQLAEQYRWAHQIMKALISNNHAPNIVARLKKGEDYGSVARSFRNEDLAEIDKPSPTQSVASLKGEPDRSQQPLSPNAMDYEIDQMAETVGEYRVSRTNTETTGTDNVFRWTNATADHDLVNHLLELYFTWVHPVHMVLSEPHFKTSFVNRETTYCSCALVNAMCAMACHFLDTSTKEGLEAAGDYPGTLGEKFMAEGRAVIRPEDHNRLTTVQAFAIMFLVDTGTGKALKGASYIRFASSILIHLSLQGEIHRDALQITLWGVSSLNLAWTEFTYQCSELPRLPNPTVFDGVRMDREDGRWRKYREPSDLDTPTQPSLALLTAFHMAEFMNILHDTIKMYYADGDADVSARDILRQYWRYLSWKDELPSELSAPGDDGPSLPHTYFLHIHYHAAVVQLFQPLIGIDHIPRGSEMDPEINALRHAEEGLALFARYRDVYGDRYQTLVQMLCVMHLADCVVRYGPPDQAQEAARLCLGSLKEALACFAVCGPLRAMFCRTLVDCGLLLPRNVADLMSSTSDYCLDEFMESCTRLSYTQPIEQVRRRIVPSIEEDWYREWQRGCATSPSGGSLSSAARNDDKLMRIQSILNA